MLILVSASPYLNNLSTHERRHHLPAGWMRIDQHNASKPLQLRIGLTQSNLSKLEELLHDVSHPDSTNYGKHWSPARIAKAFQPSKRSTDEVKLWLSQSGVDEGRVGISKSGNWIHVNSTVGEVEKLLNAQYFVYRHEESGEMHLGCEEYSLPSHITPHIDFITPTVHFSAAVIKPHGVAAHTGTFVNTLGYKQPPKTKKLESLKASGDLERCHDQIEPACLRALYGMHYEPMFGELNSFGIVEYTPQSYNQSDLDLFASRYSSSPSAVGKEPNLVAIDGGTLIAFPNFDLTVESNLDLEYAMGIVGPRQNVTLYQVGDTSEGASFGNFLDALDGAFCQFEGGDDPSEDGIYPNRRPGGYHGRDCGTTNPANVISTSYGYNEAELTPAYTARQCAEYGKLGLMGITVLYSSGDNGVAGNRGYCLHEDGSQSESGHNFNPSFPASCPYVTSVGATMMLPDASVNDAEVACERTIYSGGGFSNHFELPKYQKTQVQDYLKKNRPLFEKSRWNSTGNSRAFPDLSANGANYVTTIDGGFYSVFGTSASTPVVGAILTLINDLRLGLGKTPTGFINPAIYSSLFQDAFNDITEGRNPGCGTEGFGAAPGWDPVTGLGTPSFPKLVARWLELP
ncbi:subtilisin-like protein [Pluteus cervinus]|uniref:Subtilisin-like protein n=1 Tax=Pluteus cervinus TaxID=181527 RepID=A0ACD3A5C7_9AGAR|nr:subtilisin-like protein [Pluteus cervinus]